MASPLHSPHTGTLYRTTCERTSYSVTAESLQSLASLYKARQDLNWAHVFLLPGWLAAWWSHFGEDTQIHLLAIREDEVVIGIAPLRLVEGHALFLGDTDVCDYLDFIIQPGKEGVFFEVLFQHLRARGMEDLQLESLRPDSTVMQSFDGTCNIPGMSISCQIDDMSLPLDLPSAWEEYLDSLGPKQCREVRRKLRRIEEAGRLDYHVAADPDDLPQTLDLFLDLHRRSRPDKAAFMTPKMASFFRTLMWNMSEAGLVRFGLLNLNGVTVAAVIYFDYGDTTYLYNSGYDPGYSALSVGLVSKILCIRESILSGKKVFDFLKGDEVYKYRLGAKEIPIYGCHIDLKGM